MGVKVVADTHVLVFYLFTPDRLTDTALDALLQRRGHRRHRCLGRHLRRPLVREPEDQLGRDRARGVPADPANGPRPDDEPASAADLGGDHWRTLGAVPLEALRGPFDRFILATALQFTAPLVTADRAIAATGAAEIVW